MKSKPLAIVVMIGFGLVFALVGGLCGAPMLYAAPVEASSQPTVQTDLLAQSVLTPTKDNTLYESTTGDVSNGAGSFFFVGKTSGASTRRGLVAFDLAGKVPAGATIVSATLQLQMSKTSAGATSVSLHRALRDWGEGASNADANEGRGGNAATGDATWLHTFFNTTLWQTPGGDFAPTATATSSVAGIGVYQWTSAALVADVQGWLDDPTSNLGWVIVGDESSSGTAKRFSARENSTAANRPQLTIVYTVVVTETEAVYLPLVRK